MLEGGEGRFHITEVGGEYHTEEEEGGQETGRRQAGQHRRHRRKLPEIPKHKKRELTMMREDRKSFIDLIFSSGGLGLGLYI